MQKRETTQTRRKEKEARRREGSPASDGARGSEGPVKEKKEVTGFGLQSQRVFSQWNSQGWGPACSRFRNEEEVRERRQWEEPRVLRRMT